MAKVKHGDIVRIHFTSTFKDGTIVDSTMNKEPLQFIMGNGEVISGLEEAVEGMEEGETKNITIPSDKAFGPYNEEMIQVVYKDRFPADFEVIVGMKLQAKNEDGQIIPITVIDVSESTVTLDLNHPLAGKELFFNVNVVAIS